MRHTIYITTILPLMNHFHLSPIDAHDNKPRARYHCEPHTIETINSRTPKIQSIAIQRITNPMVIAKAIHWSSLARSGQAKN